MSADVQPKMKPLHWTRILHHVGDHPTIWDQLERPIIDQSELVALFAETHKDVLKQKKPKHPALLPYKRYNVFAIQRNRLPPDRELRQAIISFDGSKIEKGMVHELSTNSATSIEERSLREAQANGVILDQVESYVLMLLDLPFVRARLQCWDFINNFGERLSTLNTPLGTLELACHELLNSQSVRQLLALTLTVGNYLNSGSSLRDRADGFNLEVLEQMSSLQDSSKKGTLFDYIIKRLEHRSLAEELKHAPEILVVDFKMIQSDINQLIEEFELIKNTYRELKLDSCDPFAIIMPPFIQQCGSMIDELNHHMIQTKDKFLETVDFFTGDRDRTLQYTPKSFFGIWARVIRSM